MLVVGRVNAADAGRLGRKGWSARRVIAAGNTSPKHALLVICVSLFAAEGLADRVPKSSISRRTSAHPRWGTSGDRRRQLPGEPPGARSRLSYR
jgi:hypothetical protein